jgi:hypothetical protein
MNSTSVAIICVALIATPAGYAVERLYHERIVAAVEAGTPASGALSAPSVEPTYAGSPAWTRLPPRTFDLRPGRV